MPIFVVAIGVLILLFLIIKVKLPLYLLVNKSETFYKDGNNPLIY